MIRLEIANILLGKKTTEVEPQRELFLLKIFIFFFFFDRRFCHQADQYEHDQVKSTWGRVILVNGEYASQ